MPLSSSRPFNERLVFSPSTTYTEAFDHTFKTDQDYQPLQKVSSVPTKYVNLDPIARKRKQPPDFFSNKTKHTANLTEYKKPVRFDLMFKPKDIIRTDPSAIQKPFTCDKMDDSRMKDLVRRTRPRLAMTPAVNLDDVEDQAERDILLANMYTPSSLRAAREIQTRKPAVKAPLPERMAPSVPVFLPKLKPRAISEEWRWDAVFADKQRLRGHCEHEKEFWTRRKPNTYYTSNSKKTTLQRHF